MSDELKDFRYYADKAEAWLETTWQEVPGNDIGKAIAKAAVYAELAKAAPKSTPRPKTTPGIDPAECERLGCYQDHGEEGM
jgi:hypothetical protein